MNSFVAQEQLSAARENKESQVVDALLGATFVVCQEYISCVVSQAKAIHQYHELREGRDLQELRCNKAHLVSTASKRVRSARDNNDTEYTEIQVIDAAANYFKHHEE